MPSDVQMQTAINALYNYAMWNSGLELDTQQGCFHGMKVSEVLPTAPNTLIPTRFSDRMITYVASHLDQFKQSPFLPTDDDCIYIDMDQMTIMVQTVLCDIQTETSQGKQ